MTNLLRCRGAVSEIANLFAANADPGLNWRPTIWPGETVLIVTADGDGRRLRTVPWGLPENSFAQARPKAQRTGIFSRHLAKRDGDLIQPEHLERCLIVIEAFAYPDGPSGKRTRSWAGLWDEPLCAWAGVWSRTGTQVGCAGVLIPSNALISRVSPHQPWLLPDGHDTWLANASEAAIYHDYPDDAWYLERTSEAWSSGELRD